MDMEFFKKFRRHFHDQDWTNRSLADAIGDVSSSTVNNWLNGKTLPKLNEAASLARVLGVSLEYLGRDDLDVQSPDNLSETQRRILWLAGLIGYDVAASRLAKSVETPVPAKRLPDGPAPPEFVEEIPPSTKEPKRRRRRKA